MKGQKTGTRNRRETERDLIAEGLLPSGSHGGHGPEGKLSSSRGGGQARRRRRGALSPSLPVAPERRRGNHRDGDLHQQLRHRQHQLSPPLCSSVTPLLTLT